MRKWQMVPAMLAGGIAAAMLAPSVAHAEPGAETLAAEAANVIDEALEEVGTTDVVRAVASNDGGATATIQDGVVDVPATTQGTVVVSGSTGTLGVGLPDTTRENAVTTDEGMVVFTDKSAPTDVAIQALDDGLRVVTTMKDETAPTEYRFPITVPSGGRLVKATDLLGAEGVGGEVLVVDSADQILGVVEAPWAVDATGQTLTTAYTVEGTTLVQRTDTTDAVYPIVSDPKVTLGWYIYVRYNKSEVQDWGRYVANSTYFYNAICAPFGLIGGFGGALTAAICVGAMSIYGGSVRGVWTEARREYKCVEMRYTRISIPVLVGWRKYSC